MKHKGTVKLETDRLILRRFTLDDAGAMFKNWANDDEVTKHLTWPSHKSVEVSKEILTMWIEDYKNEDCYNWAIVLKENGDEPIGSIGVVSKREDISMAHIGYCIGRDFWKKGITSEALGKVIEFLFNEVCAKRIESRHDPLNPNSGKVMEKCGMKFEGTIRNGDINNTGICDYSMYGILDSDYK